MDRTLGTRDVRLTGRTRCGRLSLLVASVAVAAAACTGAPASRRTPLPLPAPGAPPAVPTADAAPPDRRGRVETLTLRTTDSKAQREVWIYEPAGADPATLPVVYFLHGVPGHARDVIENLRSDLDATFAAGARPFVLAAPDGNGEHHDDTEWADAADGTDDIETFVTAEVIPAVEGASPRPREQRALAGFSMGGYGAMNLALRNPSLFSQVVSLAGYFHIDDPDGMFGGDPAIEAANSPDHHVLDAAGLRVFLSDGTDDHEPVVQGESHRMKELFDVANLPATLEVTPGGHDWGFVRSELPDVAAFLGDGWSQPATNAGAQVPPDHRAGTVPRAV